MTCLKKIDTLSRSCNFRPKLTFSSRGCKGKEDSKETPMQSDSLNSVKFGLLYIVEKIELVKVYVVTEVKSTVMLRY